MREINASTRLRRGCRRRRGCGR